MWLDLPMQHFTVHRHDTLTVRTDRGTAEGRILGVAPSGTRQRATYAPLGRTLVLVDIENLMGGPLRGIDVMEDAYDQLLRSVLIRKNDHVVVAANHRLAVDVKIAWPACRVIAGGGADGADEALLAELSDVAWISERFDRVIIGSGDGIFLEAVHALRSVGLPVGVISRAESLSSSLRRAASFVRWIEDPNLKVAA